MFCWVGLVYRRPCAYPFRDLSIIDVSTKGRSWWSCGLRRRAVATWSLGSRFRILLRALSSYVVIVVCCLRTGLSGVCLYLIMCDLETSEGAGLDTMWSTALQQEKEKNEGSTAVTTWS